MSFRKIASVLLLLLLLVLPITSPAEEGFEIHFLDVGQGDAAIVRCDDQVMMIDGGNAANSSLVYSYLKNTLKESHIEYMICTHVHEDHAGGLAGALNACSINTVFAPTQEADNEAFSNFVKYVKKQGKIITVPMAGDTFSLGSAKVEILAPINENIDINDNSLVVRIVYGSTSFLFAGDAERQEEYDILNAGYDLGSTLLKVGHHGSDSSTSYIFLREIMPQYAIISVGKGNGYGHPTDAVLSRLRDADVTVYRTDLLGNIVCTSNGYTLCFSTEKTVSGSPSVEGFGLSTPNDEVYIGNRNTEKFHYSWCSSVDQMKETNKVELYSRDEAIKQGFVPCKNCNP